METISGSDERGIHDETLCTSQKEDLSVVESNKSMLTGSSFHAEEKNAETISENNGTFHVWERTEQRPKCLLPTGNGKMNLLH